MTHLDVLARGRDETVQPTDRPVVRAGIDSRPPCVTWLQPPTDPPRHPMLDFASADRLTEPPVPAALGPVPDQPAWMAIPDPALPDAHAWSSLLAQAMIETLQGRRAPAQLSRWIDDRVQASIAIYRRRKRAEGRAAGEEPPAPIPIVLHSIRVQHPSPQVAEVAAHLKRGRRSLAMAFRLEEQHGRWLCTALELGPRPTG